MPLRWPNTCQDPDAGDRGGPAKAKLKIKDVNAMLKSFLVTTATGNLKPLAAVCRMP